jgi:hypothetical protein
LQVGEEYCSGAWWPGEAAAEFLAHAAEAPADGVRVILGGIPAWVRSPPDDYGRMAFWLHVSSHAYELGRPQDVKPGAAAADGGI